ncbi:PREDICTED: uncharacterized protein LOC109226244 [Nicotiana attenuata]|uniref:uncharacterized protein LOC109226244 n=1 Tax=Nicotiana attenuata TaxID=49451 RepID=UPI000904F4D9|nr:PREDICTED: uncharacterized protein LOC109226244 [Nicotiana attenuata]
MANQEPEASIVNPSKEVEELDVNPMKEEMHKLKQQMVEMYQAWAKGHPPSVYPANPAYIPPLAQPQEPPTVNSSPAFPLYRQCYRTTSHTSQAPPPKQVPYPPPPVTLVFVAPPSVALQRSSSEPLFQTHENHYYPPEPTFKAPEPCSYTPHFDLSAETEKPPKNPEQQEMIRKVKSLEQSFRNMQGLGGQVQTLEAPNINQNLLSAHHETNMIEIVHKGGELKKPSQTVMMIRSSEVRPSEKSTSGKSLIKLKGIDSKPVVVIDKESSNGVAVKQEKAKVVVPGVANKPVIVVEGACTDPVIIKPVTQIPIVNSKAVPWNYGRMTVTYKGKEVKEEVYETHGLTRLGRCFAPEELRKAKTAKDNPVLVKKVVTEEEAEKFLRKMKVQDYSIVEQLRKTPAQISLLSLLIHSDEHHQTLMKILNEAHVPDKISVNHLEKIANKIFEVNRVTFSDDELPMEGTQHNRALYLTVKCEDSMVTRVLDVAVSYNLLLGRPWIHAAKAVPSTLYQMVKFEWDRQEIVVHGEDSLCAQNDAIIPFIEVEDDKGP